MKQFGSFALDASNECLWHDGVQIALAPKPFAVLRYLVEHAGRLVTHDELLDALWPETYVQPQVLRTYMLDLRKVLKDDAGQPRFIQTLPKRGYCFVAAVTEDAESKPRAYPNSHLGPNRDPSSVVESRSVAFVGREAEMEQLESCLQRIAKRQRQVVFVTGDAGIGKTALVDAFCERAALPANVARGQCVEGFGWKETYYPVMEALNQLCGLPEGESVCKALARMAPGWLAALGREPASSGPLERMAGDLCAALEEVSQEKPLILIFEDLHWADDSTLQLISALARRRAGAKLMVVATYRPHDRLAEQALVELKHDLTMRRLCAEIGMTPLPKTALRELLSRELKQETLPPGLAGFVHQRSEGNPLFAIAILELLIGQGFLVCDKAADDARWEQRAPFAEMESEVPAGLAQMIELKLERLSPEEQEMLEAGSLISVAFPAWAVAAALDKDAHETEEHCDALARRLSYLRRGGQDELPDGSTSAFYVFTHGLYREVLYQRQSPKRRARRHVRIAERLEELFQGREASVAREMAMHYEGAGEWRRAAAALRAAARHALERQAYAEASQLLEHSLRLVENLGEGERKLAANEIHGEMQGFSGKTGEVHLSTKV